MFDSLMHINPGPQGRQVHRPCQQLFITCPPCASTLLGTQGPGQRLFLPLKISHHGVGSTEIQQESLQTRAMGQEEGSVSSLVGPGRLGAEDP